MTHLDSLPVLAAEAEMIFIVSRIGVPLDVADGMELWELAAAGGLHRIETQTEHDEREIVAKKEAYWAETETKRNEVMARRKERRRRGKKVT